MYASVLALAAGFAVAAPTASTPSTWKIDPAHSEVGFKVRHLAVSNVRGKFTKFSGMLTFDEKKLQNSKVEVTIDTTSVSTEDEKRDEHLRSPEFLDVEKFPEMKFVSTKVVKAGRGLKVTGNLTLHGVTKPVVLQVEGLSKAVKDPWGGMRRGTTAQTTINRQDFGLTWSKTLETGGLLVGNEVKIELEIELVQES